MMKISSLEILQTSIQKFSNYKYEICNVFQPCLVITIDDKHYLVDTGFGRRSPRSSFYCSLRATLWSFTLA